MGQFGGRVRPLVNPSNRSLGSARPICIASRERVKGQKEQIKMANWARWPESGPNSNLNPP